MEQVRRGTSLVLKRMYRRSGRVVPFRAFVAGLLKSKGTDDAKLAETWFWNKRVGRQRKPPLGLGRTRKRRSAPQSTGPKKGKGS